VVAAELAAVTMRVGCVRAALVAGVALDLDALSAAVSARPCARMADSSPRSMRRGRRRTFPYSRARGLDQSAAMSAGRMCAGNEPEIDEIAKLDRRVQDPSLYRIAHDRCSQPEIGGCERSWRAEATVRELAKTVAVPSNTRNSSTRL